MLNSVFLLSCFYLSFDNSSLVSVWFYSLIIQDIKFEKKIEALLNANVFFFTIGSHRSIFDVKSIQVCADVADVQTFFCRYLCIFSWYFFFENFTNVNSMLVISSLQSGKSYSKF